MSRLKRERAITNNLTNNLVSGESITAKCIEIEAG
jgi:hypothetical protein